ncbi:MAG TPA: hypothetical protein VGS19_24970 [Streptosporangiaceae bacterium]|nr:hypothetical protein [Streptosporangiaceae bacterium]
MIDAAGVLRLIKVRSPEPRVVSVYVTVPLDPAQRKGMPAHLDNMLTPGAAPNGEAQAWAIALRSDVPRIRNEVSAHASEWLGHSVAIFACSPLGLLEAIPLRRQTQERAMVSERPYVRPLLAEVQRWPSYLVAVVDRRHGWLFRVSGEGISQAGHIESPTVGSKRFGGWNGFQAYRNDQRARRLALRHYAQIATALMNAMGGDGVPLVVGGQEAETSEFTESLPAVLRNRVAGTFAVDPHTMTAARVRQLADAVMARWEDDRERRLAAALADEAPGALTVIGLDACVAAANEHAVQVLMVPDSEVRPGFSCTGCGALALSDGPCPTCGGPTRFVSDVIEELAVKVTLEGGSMEPVRDADVLGDVAARRRFPAASPTA